MPTTTVAWTATVNGVEMSLGQRMSREQMRALPVGSKLHHTNDGDIEKTGTAGGIGTWLLRGHETTSLGQNINTLVWIGTGSEVLIHYDGYDIHNGEPLADYTPLPVGSVVANGDRRYMKSGPTDWYPLHDGRAHHRSGLAAGYHLERWGADPNNRIGETLEQYQERFVAHVTKAATERRYERYLEESLTALGLTMQAGSLVVGSGTVPEGTVVMLGAPDQGTFSIYRMTDGVFVRQMGAEDLATGSRVTVLERPESEVVADTRPAAEAIAAFKAAAWAEGWRQKVEHGWCSTYEGIMRQFGLTAMDALPSFNDYPEVTLAGVGDLSEGDVLGSITPNGGTWQVCRIINGEIMRVFGTATGQTRRDSYRVLHRVGEPMAIRAEPVLLYTAPVGTRIMYGTVPGVGVNYYQKRDEIFWGRWHFGDPDHRVDMDTYTPENFSAPNYRIVRIP